MPTSSSDPLPPPDDVPSYDPAPPAHPQGAAYPTPFEAAGGFDTPPEEGTPNPRAPEENQRVVGEAQELQGLQGFFRRFIPWIGSGRVPEEMDTDTDAINARAAELGIPEELIAERSQRALELLGERDAPGSANAPDVENANTMDATVEAEPEPEDSGEQHDATTGTTSGVALNTSSIPPTADEPYDDNRNQRWLAGQGMLQLRDFCTRHGTDEDAWSGASTDMRGIVSEFARRVMQLREPRSKRFILDYSLPQGAGRDVKALVVREMERVERG